MLKTIRSAGFIALVVMMSWVWGVPRAAAQESQPIPTDQCCICFFADCCFLIPINDCDENRRLISPDFLHTFFEQQGIEGQQICTLCDQCAFNPFTPEEDDRYVTICDVCVATAQFDSFQCTILPPEVTAEFITPSSCRLNDRPFITMGAFAFFGSILTFGALRIRRHKKPMGVSNER